MDQVRAQLAVLDQDLVAPAAGVGPGPRAVKHDRAILPVGRLDPEPDRERLEPVEIPQGERDVVLAAELQGLADPPVDQLRALEGLAGLGGIGPVLDLQVLDLIERKIADLPAHDRRGVRLAIQAPQPGLEHPGSRRAQPLELGLGVLDLLLGRRDRLRACPRW